MYNGFWYDRARLALMNYTVKSSPVASWRLNWLAGAFQSADNPVDRMLWFDGHTYLPDDLLVKMDIASMHCGLETRSPFLDHEVIEYCAGLPVELKVKNKTGKYLLKKLAERYYPVDFVHRTKMGFGIPLANWLRGPLRDLVMEMLDKPADLEPLNRQMIAATLQEFFEARIDHSSRIWALLMFALWKNGR
jgi:asparagine synthase (glutamine-hydrolysing)